jgi:hypothetical protein
MADELELIEAMSVLTIQRGDVIVIKVRGHLPAEGYVRIRAAVKNVLPDNEVMVLPEGSDIGIIRNADHIDTRTFQDA